MVATNKAVIGNSPDLRAARTVTGDLTAPGSALVSLTDNSGGTASDTIPAQTGSYVEATQETTVASLAGKINEIIAALETAGIISS